MDVSFFRSTSAYSGQTSVTFGSPTITKQHTALAFITCHDITANPTAPKDWNLINRTNGVSGSTFVYLNQPMETISAQTYTISNLSQLSTGFALIFSGCSYQESKVINAMVSEVNIGAGSTNGFYTTGNTLIVQFASTFLSSTNFSGWSSTPSLTWTEVIDSGFTYSSLSIRTSAAISSVAPSDNYTNFAYSYTNSASNESISTVIALTPRRTNVLMSMCSL